MSIFRFFGQSTPAFFASITHHYTIPYQSGQYHTTPDCPMHTILYCTITPCDHMTIKLPSTSHSRPSPITTPPQVQPFLPALKCFAQRPVRPDYSRQILQSNMLAMLLHLFFRVSNGSELLMLRCATAGETPFFLHIHSAKDRYYSTDATENSSHNSHDKQTNAIIII